MTNAQMVVAIPLGLMLAGIIFYCVVRMVWYIARRSPVKIGVDGTEHFCVDVDNPQLSPLPNGYYVKMADYDAQKIELGQAKELLRQARECHTEHCPECVEDISAFLDK